MRSIFLLSALVALVTAAPKAEPQSINFAAVDAGKGTTPFGPPPYPTEDDATDRRDNLARTPTSSCVPQPSGSAPPTTPDTVKAFLRNKVYKALATNAPTPNGYTAAFSDLQGSTFQAGYLGLYALDSYDVYGCQELCDAAFLCEAFNIYIERDPSVAPGKGCRNPPATFNFKCTLYGTQVSASTATNTGQLRDRFHVVITASNGYNKVAPPPAIAGFDGPTELGGAINAPLLNGQNTFLAGKFFSGPYDPSECATACTQNTAYDRSTAGPDGSYMPCNFFNAYVLSDNGVPQGLYCSLYTTAWGKQYSTNYGQYNGNDRYTVSQSYGYALSVQDCGNTNDC